MEWERRYDVGFDVELEERGEGELPTIKGHSAIFNRLTPNLIFGMFREKFDAGAFTDTIGTDDIRALWNHDPNFVLGRNRSETLRLSEDKRGLRMENDPPDTVWARDLVESIRRRDVTGQSIGFRVKKPGEDDRVETVGKQEIRTIIRAQLRDVGPVTFPAYPQTDVGVRALLEGLGVADLDRTVLALRHLTIGELEDPDGPALLELLSAMKGKIPDPEAPAADWDAETGGLAVLRRKLELLDLET